MSWPMRRLGDVCEVVPGFAFKSKDLGDAGIPVIKIGNITEDRLVDIDSAQCLPENLIENRHKKYLLQNGDILIAMTGATAGKVGRIRCSEAQSLLLNQRVAKLRPTAANPDFFWSAVSTDRYRTVFYGLGGGAAQPNMSSSQIESVEIPCPPQAQQNQIAAILSAYDNLIENNRRRIQLLEQAARLLYKEWFVHLRFPCHEHVKISNGVPEGWRKKRLGEVAPLKYGKALREDERMPGSFPVYGSSGIVGCHQKPLVTGPTIIVGRKGNVGSIYWSKDDCHPIDTVYFVDRENCSLYLYYALLHTTFISTDVAIPGLNRDFAHSRSIVIPELQTLQLFEDIALSVHKQSDGLQKYNIALTKARDLLLPRLINGEVVI